VQSIYKMIIHYLYHPLFLTFLIPLSYLLVGTLYASQYTQYNFIHFFLLYSFIFINHLLGNFLNETAKTTLSSNHLPFIIFELINLSLIYYFSYTIHPLAGLLCFFYSLVIHSQFHLVRHGYSWLTLFVSSVFKGGILTYLSFYIQANFIPITLFYWSIPLILTLFLVELGKLQLNYTKITRQSNENQTNSVFLDTKRFNLIFLCLLVSIYLVSLIFFIPTFKKLTFIFLLTLPFAVKLIQSFFSKEESITPKFKQKTLQLYSISFFIALSIILLIHIT